jgi:hypothetical protein
MTARTPTINARVRYDAHMKVVAALVCLAACGQSEYEAVFDRYDSRTTDGLYGTWSAHFETYVSRWVLAADRILFVNRCELDVFVGVEVSATVSEAEIRVLEEAHDENDGCTATATPSMRGVCAPGPTSSKRDCFEHEHVVLTIYDSTGRYGIFTKYTDETF